MSRGSSRLVARMVFLHEYILHWTNRTHTHTPSVWFSCGTVTVCEMDLTKIIDIQQFTLHNTDNSSPFLRARSCSLAACSFVSVCAWFQMNSIDGKKKKKINDSGFQSAGTNHTQTHAQKKKCTQIHASTKTMKMKNEEEKRIVKRCSQRSICVHKFRVISLLSKITRRYLIAIRRTHLSAPNGCVMFVHRGFFVVALLRR